MIKNQSVTVPFYVYNPTDGSAATGVTSMNVYVSKDGATPTISANLPSEINALTAPGLYKIALSASEMNADVVVLTFSHSTAAAMPVTISTQAQFPTVNAIQSGLSTLSSSDIPTANEIADAALSRSVAEVESTAGAYSLTTLVLAALESKLNADKTWTIYRTDGETVHVTKNVDTDSNTIPVTGVH